MAPDSIVYVVDDDEAVRDSIATLLNSYGFATRGFSSGQEFLSAAPSLESGCVISDVRMPGMDGISLLGRLKDLQKIFAAVLITGHADVKMAVEAIKLGAVDFVEKPYKDDVILAAVRQAQERLGAEHSSAEVARAAKQRLERLTPREREVLERVAAGMPSKIIAYDLSISPRTVEFYRGRVLAKMEASSLSELVRLALAAGLSLGPPR